MGQPEWLEEHLLNAHGSTQDTDESEMTVGLCTFPAAQRTDRARFVAQIERGDRARRAL